jgi:hypothetical protein
MLPITRGPLAPRLTPRWNNSSLPTNSYLINRAFPVLASRCFLASEWLRGGEMQDMTEERRIATRHALVLAAEIIELPRGAKLQGRTSDVSRTGCYVDTLNPISLKAQVRMRLTHRNEVFEVAGLVVYVSPGLGMGVRFENVPPEQQAVLDKWLNTPEHEF